MDPDRLSKVMFLSGFFTSQNLNTENSDLAKYLSCIDSAFEDAKLSKNENNLLKNIFSKCKPPVHKPPLPPQ